MTKENTFCDSNYINETKNTDHNYNLFIVKI